MLKKAGIVVAAAAAGLLALSPLAFAGDKGHGHGGSVALDENTNNYDNGDRNGLVNLTDNNVNVPVQVCGNDVPVNVLGVQVPDNQIKALTGALGVLGPATNNDSSSNGDIRACAQDGAAGDASGQGIDD